MTTLLLARGARITVDGAVAIASLSLETRGSRLVLVGHTDPLVAALCGIPQGVAAASQAAATLSELGPVAGDARATGGELRLVGRDVVTREHLAIVGAAPFDPPLPQDWTAEAYVVSWVRLSGVSSAREATARAKDALARVGLGAATARAIKSLKLPEKRALVLAAAVSTGPEVLVADRPLAGLEGAAAQFVGGALDAASDGRPSVVSVQSLVPGTAEGRVARAATDLAALVGGELSMVGAPSEVLGAQRLFRLTVRSNAEALREALAARGAALAGGPTHFSLRLAGDQDASFVLGVASEVRSAVVEIVPVV